MSNYLINHPTQTGSVGLVGGTGGICDIAAKLGAIIIADEADSSKTLAPTPASQPTLAPQGKRAPAFKGTGFVFSPVTRGVKTGPPSGVAKRAKVILKSTIAKRVKQALASQPDPGQELASQPVPIGPPGPDNSLDQFMASLQNLCEGNSLSVFRSSDRASVPETSDLAPLPEVPQVNLGIPALDALRAK